MEYQLDVAAIIVKMVDAHPGYWEFVCCVVVGMKGDSTMYTVQFYGFRRMNAMSAGVFLLRVVFFAGVFQYFVVNVCCCLP